MENEESEWAMRECVKKYREAYMPIAMQIRGYYEAMKNVGFGDNEALILTLNVIK